jgi:hypothetical protein
MLQSVYRKAAIIAIKQTQMVKNTVRYLAGKGGEMPCYDRPILLRAAFHIGKACLRFTRYTAIIIHHRSPAFILYLQIILPV